MGSKEGDIMGECFGLMTVVGLGMVLIVVVLLIELRRGKRR